MAKINLDTSGATIQQRAYEALREAVITGLFVPGELVTLRSLGERLGVSEMPVREALRRLIAEGAFESLPNHSARVPFPTRQDVSQVNDLRLILESNAIRQAVEHLSKHKLDRLSELASRMQELSFPTDVTEHARLNKEFHFGIYRESQNPTLVRLIESLWLRIAPFVHAIGLVAAREGRSARRPVYSHHLTIVECLRAYDLPGAIAALELDLAFPPGLPDYEEVMRGAAEAMAGRRTRRARSGKARPKGARVSRKPAA
jgi:DNA-binding GntR family transcriptional regulator